MRRRRLIPVAVLACVLALVAPGCGGRDAGPASALPESAAAAPADTMAFVTVDTDLGSAQWQEARALLDLFPGLRDSLTREVEQELADEHLDWERDIAPALGSELTLLVGNETAVVALLKPAEPTRLDALLAKADERVARREVGGWTVLAERQGEIDAYVTALGRGTLDRISTFQQAMAALPAEALVKAWVDGARLTRNLEQVAQRAGDAMDVSPGEVTVGGASVGSSLEALEGGLELGIDSVSVALGARDDGAFVTADVRGQRLGNGTEYRLELFDRVPGDAVAALSFGGTQTLVERLRGPLEQASETLQSTVGVSLDRLLGLFSGEGVLYLRRGTAQVPELTLVLAPPDVDETYETIDTLVRKLAGNVPEAVLGKATLDGTTLDRLDVEGLSLFYGKLDDDTLIVTLGGDGVSAFRGSSERLVDTDAFARAADAVGLGDETTGFLYVDLDGLIPLITGIGGEDALPADAREVLTKLDAFILQSSADEQTMRVSGFVGVNR